MFVATMGGVVAAGPAIKHEFIVYKVKAHTIPTLMMVLIVGSGSGARWLGNPSSSAARSTVVVQAAGPFLVEVCLAVLCNPSLILGLLAFVQMTIILFVVEAGVGVFGGATSHIGDIPCVAKVHEIVGGSGLRKIDSMISMVVDAWVTPSKRE